MIGIGLLKALLLRWGEPYIAKMFGGDAESPLPADIRSVVLFFTGKVVGSIGALWNMVSTDPEPDDNWDACIWCKNDGCSFLMRKANGNCFVLEGREGLPPPATDKFKDCIYRSEGEEADG